tara:strand:- start:19872 stop:20957 length:1086 start_codon:yes stop_codon:yes gene_type:complete
MFRSNYWIWILLLLTACSSKEIKILPSATSITESVYSSVTIQPDSLYKAYAAVNGILDRNLVEEGDKISKGTAIAQIINTNPRISVDNARLSLDLAKNNLNGNSALLNSINEEIRSAKLKLTNDSINYFRQKSLWEQQIGSKVEYDSKKLNYELSRNALKLVEDKYFQTKDQLETQLMQAENNYRTTIVTTKDFTVESKIHGKVYALYKNPGEIVSSIEPLALIGSSKVFIIEMLVDEVDIVKITNGQDVIVTLDAYTGEIFTAKVKKIYPKKDERNQTFIVEASFDQPPKVLYPGLAGEANIVVAQKSESLVIPKGYLIDGNSVKTDEGIIEIEIGLQNLDSVEIRKGISSNTWIYKPNQ